MKRFIPYILSAIILSSCSPMKRIERIAKKHPEVLITDTITVTKTIRDTITVYVDRVQHDTVFRQSFDTIVLRKDNLIVKYHYDTVNNEVYLYGECDTIKIKVPYEKEVKVKVPCDKVVIKSKWFPWWLKLLVGICVILLIRRFVFSLPSKN